MSRCNDWHNAHEGIITYLIKKGIVSEKNAIKETNKIIYTATKTGSFSQRCLEIGKDFNTFKIFVKDVYCR